MSAYEVLRLEEVGVHFGEVRAVDDVSCAFASGEVVALLGANGAGKTTLFGAIAGQHRPVRGRVVLGGEDVGRLPPHRVARRGVARSFQVARAFASFSVRDNLHLALRGSDTSVALGSADTIVEATLRVAELVVMADRPADVLSEGDRKRLDVARAVVAPASVLLLDEPTAGLSTEGVSGMIELVARIRSSRPDLCIVLTSHDMRVVRQLSTRALLLVNGRLELDGSVDEVLSAPATRRTYLGEGAGDG